MKIGLTTDSLSRLTFEELLPAAAEMGIDTVEFGCGNFSLGPHLKLDAMLDSEATRRAFVARVKDHGLAISALNCSGNQLAPGEAGRQHDAVVRKTLQLASLMDIDRVVMMSGLPGAPGDANPNWIVSSWPPELAAHLAWQWDEVAVPYWRELAAFAGNLGVHRIAIEIHGNQLVYNTRSMERLREIAGPGVGVNFDPSHLMWMGADPLAVIRTLGDAIFHVHAKDTRIEAAAAQHSVLETLPNNRAAERAWNYVTLGYGHDELWWRAFVRGLRAVGYDDTLSIEHEDYLMDPLEGVRMSVALLQRVIMRAPPSYSQD